MALSTWYGFNSTASGAGTWSNKNNATYDSSANASYDIAHGTYAWFRLYDWKGSGTLPTGSTINSIDVRCRGYIASSTTYDDTQSCKFRTAFNYSIPYLYSYRDFPTSSPFIAEGVATEYTTGHRTLSQWSMTDEEAEDLANGTGYWCIGGVNLSGDTEKFRIEYVEIQFDYDAPPGNVGMMIGNPGG